ncbi:MAG: hypothetical protein JWQ96_2952 [Segetibacter sp.]|nr:hypothetical protein [Segetibacter sp.]
MKKILMLATVALLTTGAAFACDKDGKKDCCKKGSEKKECHKKETKEVTKKTTVPTKKA